MSAVIPETMQAVLLQAPGSPLAVGPIPVMLVADPARIPVDTAA